MILKTFLQNSSAKKIYNKSECIVYLTTPQQYNDIQTQMKQTIKYYDKIQFDPTQYTIQVFLLNKQIILLAGYKDSNEETVCNTIKNIFSEINTIGCKNVTFHLAKECNTSIQIHTILNCNIHPILVLIPTNNKKEKKQIDTEISNALMK